MKDFIKLMKLEYRKMWNGISIASIAALSILTIVFAVVTLNIQQRALDKNGDVVSGLPAFRALKESAEDLEGVMDGEYIQNLIKNYNASYDKEFLEENRGFLGTGGMTKYIITNYVINYAYYGPYMSNGNDKIGLDYDFLSSEEIFYQKYKEAVLEQLLYVNEWNGLFPYTEEQIGILQKRIRAIKTPFKIEYNTGLANLKSYYGMEYPAFFILLVFCIAGCYAKDSINGIDELVLSSRYGRKKDLKARWIAANVFAITMYLIFAGGLIIVHGAIGSLHGLGASAQTFWFECILNVNVGEGLLIIFFGGLAGTLVMTNMMCFLSIKIKNSKISVIMGIIAVGLLRKGASTYSQIRLLNPTQFGGDELVTDFLFLGKTIIPYFAIVFLLSTIYIALLWFATRLSYKKYYMS